MHTETGIFIESDPMTVFQLGSATERWPEILPHYRWVYVLDREGNSKLVEMAANRDFRVANWPVRWWAAQTDFPDEPRIKFTHLGGVTKGMEVEWLFASRSNGVEVTIVHDLELTWPVIGGFAANYVIGPMFVDAIAGRTLARVKELAESGQTASSGART